MGLVGDGGTNVAGAGVEGFTCDGVDTLEVAVGVGSGGVGVESRGGGVGVWGG